MCLKLVSPIILLLLWLAVCGLELVDRLFLPTPIMVAQAVITLFRQQQLAADLFATISRFSIAFPLACFFGVVLGLLFGVDRRLYNLASFPIDFLRSMPATAIFPLFMLLFGIGDVGKIALSGFSAFLLICFNCAQGVFNCSTQRLLAARLQGAGMIKIFFSIVFWESLPQTVVGLRAGASIALVVIVLSEMFIGSDLGLGKRIIDFQMTYETAALYGVIAVTGMIGYVINLGFEMLADRLLHWRIY